MRRPEQKARVRAYGRALRRLSRIWPGLFDVLYAEELERAKAELAAERQAGHKGEA